MLCFQIDRAFLDPLGAHLALTLKPTGSESLPDLIYLNNKSQRIKSSSKIRGNLVSAIAWNNVNESENVTGTILLGTTRGLIFETEFDSGEDHMFTHNLEKTWHQVYDLGKGNTQGSHPVARPITGLEYHRVKGNPKSFFVLASTADRLYQFQGHVDDINARPQLVSIFRKYHGHEQFMELPTSVKYSTLVHFYETKIQGKQEAAKPLYPTKFAWLTGEGIYAGSIDPCYSNTSFHDSDKFNSRHAKNRKDDTVTVDCQLIPLKDQSGNSETDIPRSMVLTEFHAILAYPDRVVATCLLNEAVVFEDEPDLSSGRLKGITRDLVAGTLYAYTDYAIYQYTVEREERHVWKIFLQKGDIESAEKYCLGDDSKLDQVRTKKAENLYEKKKYVESALCYAMTNCSFEEVALKFMRPEVEKEGQTALLNFLKKRLETIRPSEKTQLTMLVVWLFEIYLNMIGNKTLQRPVMRGDIDSEDIEHVEDAFDDQTSEELFSLMKIPKVAECISNNRTTFYDLLNSHGDKKNLIRFAQELQDFDRVIKMHLQDGEYASVLDVLEIQLAKRKKPDLFYSYGPLLMPEVPTRFVDSIIRQGSSLLPVKLIPSLVVSYRDDQELQAIRYLEFCVKKLGSKERAIHNYLLSLYIKHQKENVLKYIDWSGNDPDGIFYDINYALRLCTEQQDQLRSACVRLHCILGQLDQAVELALLDADSDGLQQAKDCLRFTKMGTDPNEASDKARRIWLRIARYVVQDKNDIKQAMEFLRECDGLVKIEDILPFFPDFVTIDHFKDAICDSLQEYSKHIQDLKSEMEEAYTSAEEIRSDIQQFKRRYVFVRADDTCSICHEYVMARPFHLFVCSHRFHTDCLIEAVVPHFGKERKRKVEELQRELAKASNNNSSKKHMNEETTSIGSGGAKVSYREQIRAELDDLIASECVFCGDIMVKSIDKPFIADEDFDRVLNEWL